MRKPSRLRSALPLALSAMAFAAPVASHTAGPEIPRVARVAARAGFGAAVAVGDGEVFVGEARNQLRPGLVYVYRRGSGGWREAAQLKAPEATYADGFGSGLAVDGRTLAVGAVTQGAIFMFQKESNGTWRHVAKLTSGDTVRNTGFGGALALKGDVLLAGASNSSGGTGVVHVFRRNASGEWARVSTLSAPDAAERDLFGGAISFDGTRAVIGAPGRGNASGAVFVFALQNETWTPAATLTQPRPGGRRGGAAGQQQPPQLPQAAFGMSVHLDGESLYVGAPAYDNGTRRRRIASR